ncbi:protein kinase family protein [Candidatus Dojkabacteria bacterium]|uniref:Protein kinase family protein n=1 Tax=Candidatus Dojkabacteria bacterium TaxID=2099670 RepID=A0A5C7JB87_9BACT|nr:MAG: protein kinase family protein [Candidatus Dojkabacteria bacterium]
MAGKQINTKRDTIIMEYMEGGNLYDHLQVIAEHKFPENLAKVYFKDFIGVLSSLHAHKEKIAHRDIKP